MNEQEQSIVINFRKELGAYYASSEMDLVRQPSVSDFANRLKVNPSYLGQVLKKGTGKSALDHIHDHVIGEAKNLLSDPSMAIGEVAMILGFEYPNYFARLFRKKTGMSPTSYRASIA